MNNIKDLANNVFVQKSWEFFVDRNPIRWEEGVVKVAKRKPQFVTVTRRLLNDGGQSASFEAEGIPEQPRARIYPSIWHYPARRCGGNHHRIGQHPCFWQLR